MAVLIMVDLDTVEITFAIVDGDINGFEATLPNLLAYSRDFSEGSYDITMSM